MACVCAQLPEVAFAEDCDLLPADPAHIEVVPTDPDKAYDLSEKGYLAFERNDYHCAAFYNLQAFQYQPDAVLMQNIANALRDGGYPHVAMRYARKTLELNPEQPEVEAASALIANAAAVLATGTYAQFRLADFDATAMVVGWVRFQEGDEPWIEKGTHSVQIERAGQPPVDEAITVPKPVDVPPPPEDSEGDWRMTTGIAVSAVGAGLLVTAVVVDSMVGTKREDYDTLRACLEGRTACTDTRTATDYDALGSEISDLATIELSTLVAGGVVTAAGVGILVWALTDGADTRGDAVSWAVVPGRRGGQVLMQVTF